MAEGVNVRFAGELQRFIQNRVGVSGTYASASEYIRDLVRRDYEQEEARKAIWLRQELKPGLEAKDSKFAELNADNLISEAKARRVQRGG
ncbi:MAG: type II toxin-antitoxin system ParD family antitoxin [Verrucomicrobia bacterium]|nr:type II toxin-antitoxin system ParD family antitoxin [Verrucomicrobiota bacterium]